MLTPEYIKTLVEFNCEVDDISIESRLQDNVQKKYIAIYLCKDFLPQKKYTLSDIASIFGLVNHTSVLYALKEVHLNINQKWYKKYKTLLSKCKQNILDRIDIDYELLNSFLKKELEKQ